MEIDVLINCLETATCMSAEQIDSLSRKIESLTPVTEQEWNSIVRYYHGKGSVTWINIMTDRFIARCPNNVRARISRIKYMSGIPHMRADLINELDYLSSLDITSPDDLIYVAGLYGVLKNDEKVRQTLRQALIISNWDKAVNIRVMHQFINCNDNASAKALIRELDGLYSPLVFKDNLAILQIALRLKDHRLSRKILLACLSTVDINDHGSKGWLIKIAANAGIKEYVDLLIYNTEFVLINDIRHLEELFISLLGYGYFDQEYIILSHGLSIDPFNAIFRDGLARHKSFGRRALHVAKRGWMRRLKSRLYVIIGHLVCKLMFRRAR